MADGSPISRPIGSVGDQPAARQPYGRRRRDRPGFDENESDEFDPTPIERPDPNAPLLEALDRIAHTGEGPAPVPHATNKAKAVEAYREQTTRWLHHQPPPLT